MPEFFICRDGLEYGPYSIEEIEGYLATEAILHDDLAWTNGEVEWRPVSELIRKEAAPSSIAVLLPGNENQIAVSTSLSNAPSSLPVNEPFIVKVSSHVTSAAGIDKIEGFSIRELFSEVFKRHTQFEIERRFAVGTPATTPPLSQLNLSWPQPWMFFRSLSAALAAYFALLFICTEYKNPLLLPAVILVGTFAIPMATLLFFFEANVRQNVSVYQVLRLFMLGGALSLIVTHPLSTLAVPLSDSWLGASVAALTEEPAKLLAVLFFMRNSGYTYVHNGLLFGAAVGTGFAAFESAGYAFEVLHFAPDDPIGAMTANIVRRGVLSPFAHIVWTAIAAAAIWRVKGSDRFHFSMLRDWSFLRIFLISIVLHMAWNSTFALPFFGKYLLIGFVGWVVVLSLIQTGLKELQREKAELPPSQEYIEGQATAAQASRSGGL